MSCSMTQHSDAGEARTCRPCLESSTLPLSHCAPNFHGFISSPTNSPWPNEPKFQELSMCMDHPWAKTCNSGHYNPKAYLLDHRVASTPELATNFIDYKHMSGMTTVRKSCYYTVLSRRCALRWIYFYLNIFIFEIYTKQ